MVYMDYLDSFLTDTVPRLAARLRGTSNEASFRQEFLEGLRKGIKERGYDPEIKLEENCLVGRTDARIGFIVFEFKSPGELAKQSIARRAIKKTREYIESRPKDSWSKSLGILTDGYQIAILSYNHKQGRFLFTDELGRPSKSGQELLNWSQVAGRISRMIAVLALPHLSAETLLFHFGLESEVARTSLRSLWSQLVQGDSEFTQLLYNQWRELFSLAVEFTVTDAPGDDLIDLFQMGGKERSKEAWDESVFIVQTYYSLILKLLALRIVDELGLTGQVSLLDKVARSPMVGMLEAESSVPKLLGDVIERDVFSWPYCDPDWPPTREVVSAISELATIMQQFDVQGVKTDVLRRVYQNIIPRKLRKSLGEFYTPTWAAELLLDEIGYNGNGRILDPTCGSGTFLVAAAQRILQTSDQPERDRVEAVTRSIVGYDLNPIAVSTSRLNYVLTLVDTLMAVKLTEPLDIPVYLADSLLLPELQSFGVSPHFRIPTKVGVFLVPIMHPEETEEVQVNDVMRILRLLRACCSMGTDRFLEGVRTEIGPECEENNRSSLAVLHQKIHSLDIEEHDGIWASIMENFFAPTFQGRFEFVVGNPPWVIPRRTPASYTDKVRGTIAESAIDKCVMQPAKIDFLRLKSRSAAAEKQYFACTPFVWRALKSYSLAQGRLAFLMTSSMFTSMGSGGWRKWITRYDLNSVIDMTLVTDIHEGALCWSYIPVITNRAAVGNKVKFSFASPSGHRSNSETDDLPQIEWNTWEIGLDRVPISDSRELGPGNSKQPSEAPWLIAPPNVIDIVRKMQERALKANSGAYRLGDLYPIHMGFKADGWYTFGFKEDPQIINGIASGMNLAGERVEVEAEFVFATALGRGIGPWTCKSSYAFLPIDSKGHTLIEKEMKRYPLAWQYLMDHKRELSKRAVVKKGYVPSWFGVLVQEDAMAKGKVAIRLINTRLEAAMLPQKVDYCGTKIFLVPEQHVRFIPLEAVDEAYYLTAILNSDILRSIGYMCSSPKGGVPYREFKGWNIGFIPIVKYSENSEDMKHLVDISKRISSSHSAASLQDYSALNQIVNRLYGIDETANILVSHVSKLSGSGKTSAGDAIDDEGDAEN